MINRKNFFKAAMVLGQFTTGQFALAGETSIFSKENQVYQMNYSTHIRVSSQATDADYLKLATHHTNYLVGAIAYNPMKVNLNASGAPLRKKGDIKILSINTVEGGEMDLEYSYDGEIVLDRNDLSSFTLNLPEKLEAIQKNNEASIANCSLGAYAKSPEILPIYWTPMARYCKIPYTSVKASVTPLSMKVTYPDYPRLVKDGVIQTAILVGKMSEDSHHNPYQMKAGEDSQSEYHQITKRLKKQGFVRTEVVAAKGITDSYLETFETKIGNVKFVVKMIYGNSVYHEGADQLAGITDFYNRYLALAKESSFVVYSGHAGFMVDASGTSFYSRSPLVLDADRYQIFSMNGCQTNDSIYPFFALKDSSNLDLVINGRETIINPKATTAMIDAMIDWAKKGEWTSYPELVKEMDSVDAMLGVIGEQDNPQSPY